MNSYQLHIREAERASLRGALEVNLAHNLAAAIFDPTNKRSRAPIPPLPPPTAADVALDADARLKEVRLLCLSLFAAPSPALLLHCAQALFALRLRREIMILFDLLPAEAAALIKLIEASKLDQKSRDGIRKLIFRSRAKEIIDAYIPKIEERWNKIILADPENIYHHWSKSVDLLVYDQYDKSLEELLICASKVQKIDINDRYHEMLYINLRYFTGMENNRQTKRFSDVFASKIRDEHTITVALINSFLCEYCLDHAERFSKTYEMISPSPAPLTKLFQMVRECEAPPAVTLGKTPSGRRLIYASLVCWGRSYLDLMNDACLRSLLAKGNIPTLAAANDLVIEIVTMPDDVEIIKNLSSVRKLEQHCCIRIFTLPREAALVMRSEEARENFYNYLYLNFGFHMTRERARRHGADLMLLFPDVIYSHELLAHVAAVVSDDPRAVVLDCQNARATPVLRELARCIDPEDGSLAAPPRVLSTLLAKHMMPRTAAKMYDPTATAHPEMVMAIIFKEENGISIRELHAYLFYVNHAGFASIPKVNIGFPDNEHTYDVLHRLTDDQIISFSGPDDPFGIEISDEDGTTHPLVEDDLVDLIKSNFFFRRLGFAAARLFKRERFLHCDPKDLPGVVDPIAKAKFIDTVIDMFENDTLFTKFLPMREVDWVEMGPDGPGLQSKPPPARPSSS